jgi:hypothetical protein
MRGALPAAARLVGIGFYVALCIAIGVLGGRELDRALDTGKLFTLLGLAVGLGCGLWGLVRQLMDVLEVINRGRTESKGE